MSQQFLGPDGVWALAVLITAIKYVLVIWTIAFVLWIWYRAWKRADEYATEARLIAAIQSGFVISPFSPPIDARDFERAEKCRHQFLVLDLIGFVIGLLIASIVMGLAGVHPTAMVGILLVIAMAIGVWECYKCARLAPTHRVDLRWRHH